METFTKFLYDFLGQFFSGIGTMFSGIGKGIQMALNIGSYSEIIGKAAEKKDSSIVAAYLYDLSKKFAKFYQQCPIMSAESEELKSARLLVAEETLCVLKDGMDLVLVPYLDRM